MESNVAESGDPKTLIPTEIETHREGRNGETVDEARIEELRRMGLRPKDARRIERLERTLELPKEQDELDRVRAAAILRAEPETRKKVVGEIVRRVANEEVGAYDALCRLQELEVVGQECDFARFREGFNDRFVCYSDGDPVTCFDLMPRGLPTTHFVSKERDVSKIPSLPE